MDKYVGFELNNELHLGKVDHSTTKQYAIDTFKSISNVNDDIVVTIIRYNIDKKKVIPYKTIQKLPGIGLVLYEIKRQMMEFETQSILLQNQFEESTKEYDKEKGEFSKLRGEEYSKRYDDVNLIEKELDDTIKMINASGERILLKRDSNEYNEDDDILPMLERGQYVVFMINNKLCIGKVENKWNGHGWSDGNVSIEGFNIVNNRTLAKQNYRIKRENVFYIKSLYTDRQEHRKKVIDIYNRLITRLKEFRKVYEELEEKLKKLESKFEEAKKEFNSAISVLSLEYNNKLNLLHLELEVATEIENVRRKNQDNPDEDARKFYSKSRNPDVKHRFSKRPSSSKKYSSQSKGGKSKRKTNKTR
jgi:hypothetical protein